MKVRYSMHPDEFKLTAYAVGELEPAEQTTLEEHLRDCAACRVAVDEARAWARCSRASWKKSLAPSRHFGRGTCFTSE